MQPPRSPSRKKAPNQLTSFLSFPLQTHHQAKQQQPTTNPIFIATVSTTDCRVIQLLFSLHLWPLKLPLTPLKTGPQSPTTSFGKSINTNFFLASSLSLHPINIHHSGRQPSRRKSRGIATNTSCSGLASARHVCRRRDWKLQSLQMFLTPPGPTLALTNGLEPTCIRTASCLASSSHSFLFHLQQHTTRTFASSKRQTHRRSALSRPSQSSNSRVIGFRPPGSVGSFSHQGSSDFTAESRVSIPSRAIRTRQTSPMEHCRRRKRTHVKKTIIINSTPQPLPPPVPTRITQRSCSGWMIVGPSVSTDKRRTPAAWALLQLSNTCQTRQPCFSAACHYSWSSLLLRPLVTVFSRSTPCEILRRHKHTRTHHAHATSHRRFSRQPDSAPVDLLIRRQGRGRGIVCWPRSSSKPHEPPPRCQPSGPSFAISHVSGSASQPHPIRLDPDLWYWHPPSNLGPLVAHPRQGDKINKAARTAQHSTAHHCSGGEDPGTLLPTFTHLPVQAASHRLSAFENKSKREEPSKSANTVLSPGLTIPGTTLQPSRLKKTYQHRHLHFRLLYWPPSRSRDFDYLRIPFKCICLTSRK